MNAGHLSTATAQGGYSVTPSDTVKLTKLARGLWVGTTGNLSVLHIDGSQVTYVGVQGLIPVCVSRVNATGTTATDIVAMV